MNEHEQLAAMRLEDFKEPLRTIVGESSKQLAHRARIRCWCVRRQREHKRNGGGKPMKTAMNRKQLTILALLLWLLVLLWLWWLPNERSARNLE